MKAFSIDADGVEGGAGAHMLSPEMYERALLPVHQRMVERIDGPTVSVAVQIGHVAGQPTHSVYYIDDLGVSR